MKHLVVNADDYGLTESVSDYILDAHTNGIVTSVSILTNFPYFEESVARLKNYQEIGKGLHLNFVEGFPLTCCPSLTKSDGSFCSIYELAFRLMSNKADSKEILQETEAQLLRLLDSGITPDHVDSHQHIHIFPQILNIAAKLCEKYDIPFIRYPFESPINILRCVPDAKTLPNLIKYSLIRGVSLFSIPVFKRNKISRIPVFFGYFNNLSLKERYVEKMMLLDFDSAELMCHPGYQDSANDDYRCCISPKLKEFITSQKITLCRFSDIPRKNS